MKENKRVTLKDIARQMDVSIGTIDRAIHGRGRINAETRQLVLDKLKELGYTPNSLARALGRGRPTRITFISPANNEFWQEMIRGAQDAANLLIDYNLRVEFREAASEEDMLGEARIMEEVTTEMPDGILIVPLNAYLMQAHITRAVESGIRVATLNRDSPDSGRLFYCGENPYSVGRAIGAIHAKLLQPGGIAAYMKISSSNPNFDLRANGWHDAMSSLAPGIAVIGPFEYIEDEKVAYEIARRLIEQHGQLQAIFANTAPGTAAVAAAVRDAGREGAVCVVGIDVNEHILDLLDSRAMFASIEQSPYKQGLEAVRLMHRVLMEGYEPDRSLYYTKLEVYVDRAHYLANTQGI